jgi:hypothetical protein
MCEADRHYSTSPESSAPAYGYGPAVQRRKSWSQAGKQFLLGPKASRFRKRRHGALLETHVWIRRADFDVFKRLAIWTVFPSHADRNFIHGRLDNLVVFHVENRFPEIKFGFDGHGIVFVLGFSVSAPFHNQPTPVKPCRFRVCV